MDQYDFQFTQQTDASIAPETQDLIARLIENGGYHPYNPEPSLQTSYPQIHSFSNTLQDQDFSNQYCYYDSQVANDYNPSLPPPRPSWAPTPYSRSIPTIAAVPRALDPNEKTLLLEEATTTAYLKLYQSGELQARIENGVWELQCAAGCWVRTSIPSRIPLTVNGQFATLEAHAHGKSCKANGQKSLIQESRATLATVFPDNSQLLSLPPASPPLNRRPCPGLMITDWPTPPDTPIYANFPWLRTREGPDLLCLAGTDQLAMGSSGKTTTICPVCGMKTPDIRSHMGTHILRAARGVSESKELVQQITGSLPCGFCGRTGEAECAVTMKELSKSIQYASKCSYFEKFQYTSASKGSNNRPCRNVPVVCKLCVHDGRDTDHRPGIWRYNMETHLDYYHSEYAHPGKPVGLPLPRHVYDSIYLTDEEQVLAGVTPRTVFTNIEEKENEGTALVNTRAKKRKQDASTFAAAAGTAKRGRRA